MTSELLSPDATGKSDKLDELFAIDYRSLALFRVATAVVVLIDLASRVGDLRSIYAGSGAVPIAVVRQEFERTWYFSLHLLSGSVVWQGVLFCIAALFAAALLLGYRTRLATAGSWLLLLSLNRRVPLLTTGGDLLLCLLLFWGMFLPLGSRWSIDAKTRGATIKNRVRSIATVAVMLQIFWMYWSSGLVKLNQTWLDGSALQAVFSDTMIARPLGRYLLQYPSLLCVLTFVVLGLELIGPLLLVCPWRTRLVRSIALVAFAAMHIAIELSMNVLIFSYVSLAALTLFVPGQWWQVAPLRKLAAWLDVRFASGPAQPRQPRDRKERLAALTMRERLLRIVVVFFLIYIPVYNITARSPAARQSPAWQSINRLGDLLGFMQEWDMFAHPWGDRPVVAVAQLADGSAREILRDESAEIPPRRPGGPIAFASQRWMLLTRLAVTERFGNYREGVVLYFCRRWDAEADGGRKIESLSLYHLPSADEADPDAARAIARVVQAAAGDYQYSEPPPERSAR